MPIDLDWGDLEETFMVWKFSGRWTTEEFFDALAHMEAMTAQHQSPVRLIVDIRYSLASPGNLIPIVRMSMKRSYAGISDVIVISQSTFWTRIYDIVHSTLERNLSAPVQFVKTVDNAYNLIGAY